MTKQGEIRGGVELAPKTPEAEQIHKQFLKRCGEELAVMNKRGVLREGIVKILDRETTQKEGRIQGVTVLNIFSYLHSKGCVLKVDKELPPVKEDYPFERLDEQVIMLDAGYIATEALVGE